MGMRYNHRKQRILLRARRPVTLWIVNIGYHKTFLTNTLLIFIQFYLLYLVITVMTGVLFIKVGGSCCLFKHVRIFLSYLRFARLIIKAVGYNLESEKLNRHYKKVSMSIVKDNDFFRG